MPFPISLSGSVTVRRVTLGQALGRLEEGLARAEARALRREGHRIRFYGGLLRFVSVWSNLVLVTTGFLEVSPHGDGVLVRYRVTFWEVLVAVTLLVGTMFGRSAMRISGASLLRGLAEVLIPWLWIVGGSYALTRLGFPGFLRRAVSTPPDGAPTR